jgi:hypothetical protein
LDGIVTAQKNKLLEAIPEEDRELFKDLDIPKLEKIVEKLGGVPVGVDSTAGRSTVPTTKDWKSMTEKEKLDLTAADPAKAKELMVEAMKK